MLRYTLQSRPQLLVFFKRAAARVLAGKSVANGVKRRTAASIATPHCARTACNHSSVCRVTSEFEFLCTSILCYVYGEA